MQEIIVKEQTTGILYYPDHLTKKVPGIILISGSDGGIPGSNAIPKNFIESLINQGFVVYALAYFGIGDLPSNLVNIELEYFEAALKWCKTCSYIKEDAIAIVGQSRGGELALILGTILKEIRAIVAYSPCNMIAGGFPYPNQPAWKYHNTPLSPFLKACSGNNLKMTELDDINESMRKKLIPYHANTERDPLIISDLFSARNLTYNTKLSEIAVENISCPILLLSGEQDTIWPSTYYCESIIARLKKYNSPVNYEHISYKNAGHGLISSYNGSIYHPCGKFWCKLGGTQDGNKVANHCSLEETIKFLSLALF